MSHRLTLFCAVGAALIAACAEPTAPVAGTPQFSPDVARPSAIASPATDANCTFDAGTLRCVTVEQSSVTRPRTVVSGCLAGPTGVPGRRETTFQDTILVTTTTVSLRRGYAGIIYNVSTSTTETLTGSVLLNSTCTAI